MPRPRKWLDDAQRRENQNQVRKIQRASAHTKFIGVDGEGCGNWRNHKYVLLGVGNVQIESSDGLKFSEIMEFLFSQFLATPTSAYVGFFLSYDFTQWVKTLPENRARMLLTDQGKVVRLRKIPARGLLFPVRYDGWEFDMLGTRRFKLRPEGGTSWMYINDAGPFFQTSFLSAIDPVKWNEPIVTDEEYATLKTGKDRRDVATLDDDMRFYNRLENEILARLMGKLEPGFHAAGVRLKRSQWFGPGQAAQKWLTVNHIPDRATLVTPPEVEEAARKAYYGGWFEIMAHGHIPGTSWEYDINSAYPHVASRLPCFLHGKWGHYTRHNQWKEGTRTSYSLVHAQLRGSHPRIGAMLHRCPDHSIRRPWATAGWFWAHELDASYRAGLIDSVDVSEAWSYEPCPCDSPMDGLRALYEARLRVGKDTPEGKAYKLLYNSMYGKFAQSVGNPKFQSYLIAGLITAGCRTQILDAIATHPQGANDVVMVATDAVYFRQRSNTLKCDATLGNWEEKRRENMCLFKPGVYWDDAARNRINEGGDPAFKARGVSARDFSGSISVIDAHFARWAPEFPAVRDPDGDREGWFPRIEFPVGFSMVTAKQALARGKWFLAGAVTGRESEHPPTVVQDSDPVTKRHSGTYEDGVYWSQPYGGWWEEESTPYRNDNPPDPEEFGITDDGYVGDHWYKGLHE